MRQREGSKQRPKKKERRRRNRKGEEDQKKEKKKKKNLGFYSHRDLHITCAVCKSTLSDLRGSREKKINKEIKRVPFSLIHDFDD